MGCLTSIVRRLVCNKPQIHGGSAEENARPGPKPEGKAKLASPGIVARLMGLESMPVFPYTPPPNSITRSRSTGSIDSLPAFLLSGERRTRSSASFREEPTYLRPENDDFLLLTFYPDEQFESFKATKRRENKKKTEDCAKPIKSKSKKQRKNKKRRRLVEEDHCKPELERDSENSSPDSVLVDPFDVHDGKYLVRIPDESDDKRRSSRRKLASELIEFIAIKDDGGLKLRDEEISKPSKDETRQVWESVCKLADEEAEKSNWISGKWEEGEVAVITGIEILDFLLNEVVRELYFN